MRNESSFRQVLLTAAAVALAACGGAPPVTSEPGATGTPPAAAPAAAAPAEGASPAPAGAGAADAKVAELAKAALGCKFDEEALEFDQECAGYKAWTDEEALFEEGKGAPALLAMLEDADLKKRLLAVEKGLPALQPLIADKKQAARLVAVAKKETDGWVANSLGSMVARVDLEKLGLGDDLRALAKHPVPRFRGALAFHLLGTSQTPLALELARALLQDPERDVKESALTSLSAPTPGTDGVCKLAQEQLGRTDDVMGHAHWKIATSKCTKLLPEVVASLEKKTPEPARITNSFGVTFSLAVDALCSSSEAPAEVKKKAFAVAKKLVDGKVPDVNTRVAAVDDLARCDAAAAEPVLTGLAKDKDKSVAEKAKKELEALQKKKGQGAR